MLIPCQPLFHTARTLAKWAVWNARNPGVIIRATVAPCAKTAAIAAALAAPLLIGPALVTPYVVGAVPYDFPRPAFSRGAAYSHDTALALLPRAVATTGAWLPSTGLDATDGASGVSFIAPPLARFTNPNQIRRTQTDTSSSETLLTDVAEPSGLLVIVTAFALTIWLRRKS